MGFRQIQNNMTIFNVMQGESNGRMESTHTFFENELSWLIKYMMLIQILSFGTQVRIQSMQTADFKKCFGIAQQWGNSLSAMIELCATSQRVGHVCKGIKTRVEVGIVVVLSAISHPFTLTCLVCCSIRKQGKESMIGCQLARQRDPSL